MIYKNNKVSAWSDTPENIVLAAHEVAFSKRYLDVDRVWGRSGALERVLGSWETGDEDVKDAALKLGYWVSQGAVNRWEIHITWSQDPSNPPRKGARHKDQDHN